MEEKNTAPTKVSLRPDILDILEEYGGLKKMVERVMEINKWVDYSFGYALVVGWAHELNDFRKKHNDRAISDVPLEAVC